MAEKSKEEIAEITEIKEPTPLKQMVY